MEQKTSKLLKSKTSLPSLQTRVETMPHLPHLGMGARPGTQDDFKVTVHNVEKPEEADEPSLHNELVNEREPTTTNLNQDEDQNFMKEDVLLRGKTGTAAEPRAFKKIVETMMQRAKEPESQVSQCFSQEKLIFVKGKSTNESNREKSFAQSQCKKSG